MINSGIEAVLIMNMSGLPLLFQQLDPRSEELDSALLSSFLRALQAFSSEVMVDESKDFSINYGKRNITLVSGKHVIFAGIQGPSSVAGEISSKLRSLIIIFEQLYCLFCKKDCNSILALRYESFREVIAEQMGFGNVGLDWIPQAVKMKKEGQTVKSPILEYVDGKNSIKDIISMQNLSKEKVLLELSKLLTQGVIYYSI